jgi:uncharacterized membrane protein YedE/YeeE
MSTAFTPFASFIGGALIGVAAVLLLATSGRIAGISGIASRLFPPYEDKDLAGRIAFLAGLFEAPFVVMAATGAPIAQTVSDNLPIMAAAGLLVGFGSVWGYGCTSGHGVCGLARFSLRSLLATIVFMAAAGLTVLFTRHILGG